MSFARVSLPIWILFLSTCTFADDFVSLLTGRMGNKTSLELSGREDLWLAPERGSGSHDRRFSNSRFSLNSPLNRQGDTDKSQDIFRLQASLDRLDFGTPVSIPNSTAKVDSPLWIGVLGASWRHSFEKSSLMTMFDFGSASDRPFKSTWEDYVNVTSIYTPFHEEPSHWIFLLNYSTNRTFLAGIPLPGAAYIYMNGNFVGVFGFPFMSLVWSDRKSYQVALLLSLWRDSLEASHSLTSTISAYTTIAWEPKSYLHEQRDSMSTRLCYDEKRAGVGLKWKDQGPFAFQLGGGYTFDRFMFEGRSVFDVSSGRARFENDWYAEAKLNYLGDLF